MRCEGLIVKVHDVLSNTPIHRYLYRTTDKNVVNNAIRILNHDGSSINPKTKP